MDNQRNEVRTKQPRQTRGFGESVAHHFVVTIPPDRRSTVTIAEQYGETDVVERCVLAHHLWAAIAEDVRYEFNQRLKEKHLPTGRWRPGENKVERLLGKELLVLVWAIEQQLDSFGVGTAIRNWRGLRPEERWWLCTMTAAATGRPEDAGRGWRKALFYILLENPVS
ncbi:hypothetical protein KSF_106810 [Reticulibacter mediterranei]|uniref:DUF3780 domain-containing protein n=1 Tax=Reticulibacter mediterranei TaxID=2778369 RepID=A0A8J3IY54_9CHLR|nr:DUF3780 domain-containing protein [Reticulibacter mediterranei]GHP00634.1 hypothetical protein KSF_106810 [Reticulibacter mediterranei]